MYKQKTNQQLCKHTYTYMLYIYIYIYICTHIRYILYVYVHIYIHIGSGSLGGNDRPLMTLMPTGKLYQKRPHIQVPRLLLRARLWNSSLTLDALRTQITRFWAQKPYCVEFLGCLEPWGLTAHFFKLSWALFVPGRNSPKAICLCACRSKSFRRRKHFRRDRSWVTIPETSGEDGLSRLCLRLHRRRLP